MPTWAVVFVIAGTSAVFWWASSLNQHDGPDRIVGPYHVPIALEIIVGVAATASMLLVLAVRPRPEPGHGLARRSAALLILAGLVTTGSWRVTTLGGDGANIGGGAAFLISPFIISGLLLSAVFAEQGSRGKVLRWLPEWVIAALLPAVLGIALWTY